MRALHELQTRRQLPGHLAEDLVLLVGPWERGVRAGLAVVVAQVLVSREKPQPLTDDRASQVRREVAVPDAFVSAEGCASGDGPLHRLTGQAGGLSIVRRVVLKPIASLFGDDVEHGPLDVAVFG